MKTWKRFHFLILLIVNLISVAGIAQENKNRIFDASSVKIAEIKTNTIRSDFWSIGCGRYFVFHIVQ